MRSDIMKYRIKITAAAGIAAWILAGTTVLGAETELEEGQAGGAVETEALVEAGQPSETEAFEEAGQPSETETEAFVEAGQPSEAQAGGGEPESGSENVSEPAVLEEFELSVGRDQPLSVANITSEKISEIYVRPFSGEDWSEDLLSEGASVSIEDGTVYDLKTVDASGKERIYFNLKLAQTEGLQLGEKDGAAYVKYHDVSDGSEVDTSAYPLTALDAPEIYYVTTRLYLREEPDTESEILGTAELEQEIEVLATAGQWYLARMEDGYGYISGKYMTNSVDEAQQYAAAETAAREAAERAAAEAAAQQAAAQQAAAQQSSSRSGSRGSGSNSNSGSKKEVSREKVPSCDDPDHGTIYITYSDGSVKTKNY